MTAYPNLKLACEALGHKHVSIEALTVIQLRPWLWSDAVQDEFNEFMDGMRRLVGPVEEPVVSVVNVSLDQPGLGVVERRYQEF